MTRLRALVVDDERPARARLRRLLADVPGVEAVGEAEDGRSAVAEVARLRPDLVFLDIQMPGLDGFGVLEALGAEPPAIVFVTAYDEHAVRAFEVEALDYLLKPVSAERLRGAVERAVAARRDREFGARLDALLTSVRPAPRYLERVVATVEGRTVLVPLAQVTRIESDRNYVVFHAPPRAYPVRGTLGALEARLDPARWVRVNRATIVPIAGIAHAEPWFHGEHHLTLRDGSKVVWTRRYLDRAAEVLGPQF